MIEGAIPCPNCGSENVDWSFGAMFGCASVFCTDCGCLGGSSETEHKEPEQEVRKVQALELWNKRLIERTAWDHKGGSGRFYPPVLYEEVTK